MFEPLLVSCYGIKIQDCKLRTQMGDDGRFEYIPLNTHTMHVLSDGAVKINSFTLTDTSLSISFSRENEAVPSELVGTVGIDGNLRNLAVGNDEKVTFYNMSRVAEIAKNTREIVRSFRRDDVRILRAISSKYGRRRRERVRQMIHGVTRRIVQDEGKQASDSLRRNRRHPQTLSQGKRPRKAVQGANELVALSRDQAAGRVQGSMGRRSGDYPIEEGYERDHNGLREMRGATPIAVRGDLEHRRQLWSERCGRWMDRDLIAVLNISRRGRVRFARSSTEGGAGEAVKGNAEGDGEPLILRVDASKLHGKQ
jgi:putative transposase